MFRNRAPLLSFLLLCISSGVLACGDHEHGKRALPSSPLTSPSRPLEWGDINILHTTDTHGWLLGHQKASFPEPNYSGDFGDFSSFVSHMKTIALEKDVDLLLVDSGDIHDGTGLTDGYPPGGINAHDASSLSTKFLMQLPYDVMAIGNHELYTYANTLDMHTNFAPQLKGRYLSSNANITVPDKHGKPISVPVGERFAKFRTRKGRRITAFGVLFDFTGNDKNTTTQRVSEMVKEKWFRYAIMEEPDVFLLVGHMPVSEDNWPLVVNAIRAVHPTTPIMTFGGHSHIRDCIQYDGHSMGIQSGRYMETIGWMSAKLSIKQEKNTTFSRRYLDPNRVTYEYHAGRSGAKFDTYMGKKITRGLKALAQRFNLDFLFGTTPRDYTLSQAPYPSENSLHSLYIEEATPGALSINNTRADIPRLLISNSGLLRFDVYSGPFTKNDQLSASPFADRWLYIPNVKLSVANQVLNSLNQVGEEHRRSLEEEEERAKELYAKGEIDAKFKSWLEEMDKRNGPERRAAGNLTLGYVTEDSCPGTGDDTLHAPLPYHRVPDFIQSRAPDISPDSPIDLIFVDFIEKQLVGILNRLQTDRAYASSDVQEYSKILTNEVLGVYAQGAWN
ncbi:hypothetical protein PLEOSDRAFT_1105040 [Pleurotus ostreatus PC15]|uniref:Uncharacterized protein n=1 Tax=Pleurotus ostreatus (strain PC15) TaxID=1137138 RepID=A0A067NN18_PLEO1|nr:hypothetical protein PLEOSDRAFT_1105040 [Pleurotus ostreatus PC15]